MWTEPNSYIYIFFFLQPLVNFSEANDEQNLSLSGAEKEFHKSWCPDYERHWLRSTGPLKTRLFHIVAPPPAGRVQVLWGAGCLRDGQSLLGHEVKNKHRQVFCMLASFWPKSFFRFANGPVSRRKFVFRNLDHVSCSFNFKVEQLLENWSFLIF